MKPPRVILVLRGTLAFIGPAAGAVIAGQDVFKDGITPDEWASLIAGILVAGVAGLNSWFDKAYGDATAPAGLNYSTPRVSPEERVVRALVAKDFDEATARRTVALNLRAGALLADVPLDEEAL